jgi:rubrerythrin
VPARGTALRELAEDDSSRKRFLKMVGGAGAVSAFGVLLAACGGEEPAETTGATDTGETTAPSEEASQSDLKILNYALTLEFLEAKFYRDVLSSDVKPPSEEIAQAVQTFGEHEQEHVEALAKTIEDLGGTPVEDPNGDFSKVINAGAQEILTTAAMVENLGAGAYLDQAPKIQSKDILAAALAIHTVEARHAAALNEAAGFEFTGEEFQGTIPDGAFAEPIDMGVVMETIQPFLPSGSQ